MVSTWELLGRAPRRLSGAAAVAAGLEENGTLLRVNLGWNGFANDGAKAMAAAMAGGVATVGGGVAPSSAKKDL